MNDKTNQTMNESYAAPARALHWAMAAGFVFMWACGFVMSSLEDWIGEDSPLEELLYTLHMSTGALLLALLIARIAVRRAYPPPAPVAGLSRWEESASKATHILLYVLPAAVIFAGWAEADTGGHGVPFYGLFEFPGIFPDVEFIAGFEVGEVLETVHAWLAYTMLGLAVLHLGAVVKHRWFDHNDVLHRMAPRFRVRK